jgi:hypothetical protein
VIEIIVGSSVIAALITAIVGGVFKIFDNKRVDNIRAVEREEARKDRAAELELEDRRQRASREDERLAKRAAEGRAQALVLLKALEDLEAHFDAEPNPGPYRTYHYKRDLNRPITSATRLLPDASFREFVSLAMQVVSELWVPGSVGEGPEEPGVEQRRIVRVVMEQVGRYVTDDGWDRTLVTEMRSSKDAIDEYYEEYFSSKT